MLFTPHTARIFTRVEGQEVETAETLPGHLVQLSLKNALESFGIDSVDMSVFMFDFNRADEVKVGYRLLVNGNTYEVVQEPQKYNSVIRLERAKALLKRVV